METVVVENDIKVYCVTAESFPDCVLDAHKKLHAMIPTKERRYFGISRPEKGVIVYKAAAEVLEEDKEDNIHCESFVIKEGKYICITVLNYMKDPKSIGKAFSELISYSDIDPKGYCIEYYYTDEDVKCMVRLNDVD